MAALDRAADAAWWHGCAACPWPQSKPCGTKTASHWCESDWREADVFPDTDRQLWRPVDGAIYDRIIGMAGLD